MGGMGALAGMMGGMGAMQGMGGAGGAMQGAEPTIDLRNDPELRAKLEQILGRKLTPGTSEHIDTSNDPALAMQIMQVIQAASAGEDAGRRAAQPGDQGGGDALSKLERLAALRDSGALTDAEFDAQKKQLLGDI